MGRGLPKNDVVAHMWFDLSASHGNPGAVRRRDFIAQRMTPAQIAEAQKLARKWQEERSNE
jgi:TPR repeat protein